MTAAKVQTHIAKIGVTWDKLSMTSYLKKAHRLYSKLRALSKSEESLRLEKERFDHLVHAVQDYAIFAMDSKGHIKSWNAGAERFKGYKSNEVMGKHFSMFYPEDLKQSKFPDFELSEARKNGTFRHEGLRIRKDGTSFWANVVITAIYDKNKKLTGFLKVTRDMTEIRNAQQSLEKLNSELEARVAERTAELFEREKELKEAKDIAESANAAKSSFVANMSHEIRTPLGAILGFSELLSEENVSTEEKRIAEDAIKRNGKILTDLINDVLDLAKVEANRLEIERNSVNIKQLAEDLKNTFLLRAEQKNIAFNLDIAPGLPERIWTDALRTKQILINLLSNAMKFTRTGSVELKIFTSGGKLRFQVKDSGVGISSTHIKRLFIPFQQADPSITREFGGTGLGLVLSKRLAMAMGGDILLLESVPGVGTTFEASITLIPDNVSLAAKKAENFDAEKNLLRGKRILVVDDNADNRILLTSLFKSLDIAVTSAVDGQQGIEKALSWSPDFVLMDLQMPVMGGIEAMERLRAQSFSKPIIALTANALREEKDKCLQLGFDDYLTKPIERSVFFSCLAKFVE